MRPFEQATMRKAAVIVGVLFWISNLTTLVGSVIAGSIPNPADTLRGMYPRTSQVVAGTLVAHVNDVAIIGYALVLFTVLRQWNEALALGYVAFKVLEATLLAVAGTMLLSLIGLSQQYLATGVPDARYFEASATLALSQQFWAARLAALAYVVATPMLNVLLYRSQLVPRFISVGDSLRSCCWRQVWQSASATPRVAFSQASSLSFRSSSASCCLRRG
jgi:Domain of unknown function (DUF4386)